MARVWESLLQKECRSSAGAVLTGISGEVAVGIVLAVVLLPNQRRRPSARLFARAGACVALFLPQSSKTCCDADALRKSTSRLKVPSSTGRYISLLSRRKRFGKLPLSSIRRTVR